MVLCQKYGGQVQQVFDVSRKCGRQAVGTNKAVESGWLRYIYDMVGRHEWRMLR